MNPIPTPASNYPPLPKAAQKGWIYTAEQMRAYVAADRKARATAEPTNEHLIETGAAYLRGKEDALREEGRRNRATDYKFDADQRPGCVCDATPDAPLSSYCPKCPYSAKFRLGGAASGAKGVHPVVHETLQREADRLNNELHALRAGASPEPTADLISAAHALVRWHLDQAEVHPCDAKNDDIRALSCSEEVQTLRAALAAGVPTPEPRDLKLRDAARSLSANVEGPMRAFETDMREIMGNTNWSAIMQCVSHVEAALATVPPEIPPGSASGDAK